MASAKEDREEGSGGGGGGGKGWLAFSREFANAGEGRGESRGPDKWVWKRFAGFFGGEIGEGEGRRQRGQGESCPTPRTRGCAKQRSQRSHSANAWKTRPRCVFNPAVFPPPPPPPLVFFPPPSLFSSSSFFFPPFFPSLSLLVSFFSFFFSPFSPPVIFSAVLFRARL